MKKSFTIIVLALIASLANAQEAVKAGDKISGTVCDETGPLMGATVCEMNAYGRIIESAITDNNGHFIMKVQNPEDILRFSYVGMKTTKLAIDKKEYKIKLQPVRLTQQDILKKRQSGPSTLPIPQREISYKDLDQIMEERGMVKAEDLELEGDPVISNRNNPRGLISLTDEEQALVTSVNDLGFNLIRTISLLDPKSILLSPLGMTFALGQINNGAAGETRKQINQVLGCKDKETAKINNFCRKMLTEAPQLDKTTQLEITNEFISPKSFTPKPAFTQVVKDSYDTQFMESESEPLKFTLKNTIYFKGIWADKFRKMNTRDEVFRCESGIETTVPMMNQFHQFFYTENDLCQALCLPYSNGAYQMIILLPKEEKTVCNVAWSLTADSWKKMYAQMQRIDVDVKLPRFETESEENLAGTMTPLMPNAFRMNKADFSNLFDVKSCIDRIKQKGHIKVDETGAEASVITSLQGDLGSVKTVQPETVRFYANHPFLYFIREYSTGTIFFIGQYMGLY